MKAPAKSKGAKPAPRRTKQSSTQTRPLEAKRRMIAGRGWWFPAALFAVGLLIYAPAFSGPFFLDDYDLREAFSTVRAGDWKNIVHSGRPLLMLSFIANYRLSGFGDTFGFHLINVLLHCLNALLLWRFLRALFAPGRLDEFISPLLQPLFTCGVAALFLVSPIQTESVAYISSRSEVLAATFFIAALWAFASSLRERHPWYTAFLVLLLFVCSLSCKQDKITLPFVILLMDYLLLARLDRNRMKASLPTYALFVIGMIGGFFVVIKPFLFAVSAGFHLPWQQYLLTQFRMYFFYLRLLLVPFGLNADWDIAPSETIWEHLSWLGLLGLAALVFVAFYCRRRSPLISFGTLFYLLVLAPTTSFFPLLDFAAERRLYLPSIGFFLVLMTAILLLSRDSSRKAFAVLGLLACVYLAGTLQRSRLWGDDLALWHDTAKKSPHKYRPLTWLGKLYDERGSPERAIYYWTKAEKLVEPGTKDRGFLLSNLGVAHAKQKEYAKAADYYRKALEIRPRQAVIWANLAVAQLRLGREKQGWSSFARALKINPSQPEVYFLRGQEFYQHGLYEQAAQDFERIVEMRPEDERAANNLKAARAMLQRTESRGGSRSQSP